jgi:ppGpp synthetase/RelA/SpoT-type nucleotidyltranferase
MTMPGPNDSRLKPYHDFIFKARRGKNKMSYARIAQALQDQHGIRTTASNVHRYVRVHTEPEFALDEAFADKLTEHLSEQIRKFLRRYRK